MKFKKILPGAFPYLLRNIYDPPPFLYCIGELPDFELHPPIAVVGSRKPTEYGRAFAEKLAGDLAAGGLTVISGLAYGIDSAAHRGVLQKNGITIAVTGSGPDIIYPPVHKELADEIIEKGGAVVTEFEPGEKPLPFHFLQRNRIISGLSLGVVVVEAAIDSGSLSTARHALEQGREVFAVPGRVGEVNSAGTHRLIRDGAAIIDSAQDVIDILSSRLPQKWRANFSGQSFGIGDRELKLLKMLNDKPKIIDKIVEESGLKAHEVMSMLTVLECSGLVKDESGKGYVKIISND